MLKRLKGYAIGFKNRFLQHLARFMPGETTFRVWCHRWRGIKIGKGACLGYDLILDTEHPDWIWMGKNVEINMRSTLIAHFKGIGIQSKGSGFERISIKVEDDVFIGPGVIVLPNVILGRGSTVAAGSVVTKNVPSMTLVRGNPAVPVARCGIPLAGGDVHYNEFLKKLKPYKP